MKEMNERVGKCVSVAEGEQRKGINNVEEKIEIREQYALIRIFIYLYSVVFFKWKGTGYRIHNLVEILGFVNSLDCRGSQR